MKNKLLNTLASFDKFGTGICFERISLAYDLLRIRRYFYTTHITVITGTNGKGSTASALSNLLVCAGKQTGLFTSPHFIEFNERFMHQGQPIGYQQLDEQLDRLLPIISQIQTILGQKFGRFEVLFLLALCVFESKNIQYLVIEAGIGGRFDPVRTLQAPLCALTSIDLEHTQLLGNTLEAIACDKLDATPPQGQCIMGQLIPTLDDKSTEQNYHLETALNAYAEASEFGLTRADDEVTLSVTPIQKTTKDTAQSPSDADKLCIRINMHDPHVPPFTLKTPNLTPFDILNWQCALALFKALSKIVKQRDQNASLSCHPTIIEQAFNQQPLAGRFECIGEHPRIIVDAAHTPNAYQWLFNTIEQRYLDKPCIFVVGLSQGRDIEHFKALLSPFRTHASNTHQATLTNTVITTQAHNGIDAKQLSKQLDCQLSYADIGQAIDKAKQLAIEQDGQIFVVGGLFLGAAASAYVKGLSYNELNF